ncbi:hypothetical protein G6011_05231 [Alternaria panax]|uniref:Uncharacterized protein n=1 Tax=Alternaria panax TaxID=48097 RepID=A0AAD4FCC4_9PLEO|nr:hypothetical protein G6011_05231 [Alternaria panax]
MATYNPAVQPFDLIQHFQCNSEYDPKAIAGFETYAPLRYSSDFEMVASESAIHPYDNYQRCNYDSSGYTMTNTDPTAQQFNPDQIDGDADNFESLTLSATAQSFVPVKSSELDAAAPSFLLSRLAIFDPPTEGLIDNSQKCTLVLPNERDDNITDSAEMMQYPQNGQVGRFTCDTILRFNKGRHHHDPVLAAMSSIIHAQRKKNFDAFALKPDIRPADDAPPLWPSHLNLFDIKSYYFKSKAIDKGKRRDGEEEAKWITILPNGSPPTAETIHIHEPDNKKWVVFGSWLDERSKSQDWFGWTGHSLLFKWYKLKGSKCRFEEFPAELREKIYRVALGGQVYPLSSLSSRAASGHLNRLDKTTRRNAPLTLGLGYHRRLFRHRAGDALLTFPSDGNVAPEDRKFVYAPHLELSGLNRQFRDEFLHYAWVQMRSRFFNPGLFRLAMDARTGSAMSYKHLSEIELSFTNAEWYDFFGVLPKDASIEIQASKSFGPRLQTLDSLHDLQLHFRSPDDGRDGSHWGDRDDKFRLPRYGGEIYGCCQRTMVDWICTFAYLFLVDKCQENKLKVTLTGAVKTDTKEKWETISKNKRNHDQDAALNVILETPNEGL